MRLHRRRQRRIVGGRNLYPYDLEDAVAEAHPMLRRGCVACFSVDDGEGERLVVLAEVREPSPDRLRAEVAPAIRQLLERHFHVAPTSVAFLSRGRLPKTTSGKIQRAACRAAWRGGSLPVLLDDLREVLPSTRISASVSAPLPALDASSDAASVEVWLVAWLARTLGVDAADIDPTRPHAELGLDSLQLLPVVGDLEQRLGRRIEPATLYDHDCLRDLARHLADPGSRASQPARSPQLLSFSDAAPGAPRLICPPPAGGSAFAYRALARALSGHAGLLALQAAALTPGLFERDAPRSIPETAGHYLDLLRAEGVRGPWFLCGYSLGGVLAVEMARQLLADGEALDALVLIDSPAPVYRPTSSSPLSTQELDAFMGRAVAAGLLPEAREGALAAARRDEMARGFLNMTQHRPAPLDTEQSGVRLPVTMLRATRHDPQVDALMQHPAFREPDFGWGALLPALRVRPVEGDHLSLAGEDAGAVARQITALLAELRGV